MLALGSYKVRTVGCTSSSLSRSKAVSCSGPQSHDRLVLNSSRNGWVRSAMRGENFPQLIHHSEESPQIRNCVWRLHLTDGFQLVWVGLNTAAIDHVAKEFHEDFANSHFVGFSVTLASRTRLRTCFSRKSCSFRSFPKTSTSSMRHTVIRRRPTPPESCSSASETTLVH